MLFSYVCFLVIPTEGRDLFSQVTCVVFVIVITRFLTLNFLIIIFLNEEIEGFEMTKYFSVFVNILDSLQTLQVSKTCEV